MSALLRRKRRERKRAADAREEAAKLEETKEEAVATVKKVPKKGAKKAPSQASAWKLGVGGDRSRKEKK